MTSTTSTSSARTARRSIATLGDERQLNDGSFNAGLDSGSSYEWTDQPNRLHFYVVDKTTDAQGVLHYKVAVKSLDGAGPQTRGVALQSGGSAEVAAGQWSTCTFGLKNTGVAAATDPALHPQDSNAFLGSDVYRLSAAATGTGWSAKLVNALTAVKFGETVKVPVYVTKAVGAAANGTRRPDGDVGERSVRHADRGLRPRLRRRRRLGAGDAVADDGHAGRLRRVHAGRRQGSTPPRPRPTWSPPPATRPSRSPTRPPRPRAGSSTARSRSTSR